MAEDLHNAGPVLPEPGKGNILITSALPYVNNILTPPWQHHRVSALRGYLCQVLQGAWHQCSVRSIYVPSVDHHKDKRTDSRMRISGTDEYGTTAEARALVEGCTPKELCDKYRVIHAEIYQWFNISFDTFGLVERGLGTAQYHEGYAMGNQSPLPGYEQKVIYPWFDACIGYISITACYTDQWEKWWRDPRDDNVVFHSIVFPATQIGTKEDWTKLHHLSATEYLTYEGGKFSKSRGIGVDTEFTWDSFISDNNNRLLKNLGNFVNRVLKFINSPSYDSVVPDWTEYHHEEAAAAFDGFRDNIAVLLTRYIQELDAVRLRAGLPSPPKCAAVIGLAVNLVHLLAALLAPYMPDTARSINRQLGADPLLPIPDRWRADSIRCDHRIGRGEHLFRPIDPGKAREWREAFGAEEARKVKGEEAARKVKNAALRAAETAKAGS
ncbi:tRNA synthetases class I (M)-domain-containing protein [Xylariomycetidae sp. FL2044]|nr:tRNA synthetases class I (M)-domain-containing protein [Xylariomycetidae sp. FL2044]